ncbi:hypothetical protein [Botryobacter ruber]|uniref:hypothetical protein n=1 Tax=Botryobacter ruber TaxID=2171629 RepID=UPI000FEC90EE|nr:hypothetical protein [Botryobacter ruber]
MNRRTYRILLAVACFVFAGVKAYQILQGESTTADVLFMIAFLVFGLTYVWVLLKKDKRP